MSPSSVNWRGNSSFVYREDGLPPLYRNAATSTCPDVLQNLEEDTTCTVYFCETIGNCLTCSATVSVWKCGNAICDFNRGETCSNCPQDCALVDPSCSNNSAVCGNGLCETPDETTANCSADCPANINNFHFPNNPVKCNLTLTPGSRVPWQGNLTFIGTFSTQNPIKDYSCFCANTQCDTNGSVTLTNLESTFICQIAVSDIYGNIASCRSTITICGNKICDPGESPSNCSEDCATPTCNNNGTCDAPAETTANCPGDCPLVCNNNGTCDAPIETIANCPTDCRVQVPTCPAVTVGAPISASGLQCLRDSTNAKRTNAGLAAFDWKPDSDDTLTPGTTTVKARHFTDLYTAILEIYSSRGQTPSTTTPTNIVVGQPIKADHFNNLKNLIEQAP